MFGSIGRGTEDAWSDFDVWIVLEDVAFQEVAKRRRDFAKRIGEPLFFIEAPQNGPPGGTYLMSVHDAPTGPHAIDWYFQPATCARQTQSRRVLVNRPPSLSTAEPDTSPYWPQSTPTPEQDDANRAAMFWLMTLVQGKHVARKPYAVGLEFEAFILNLLGEVAEFRGHEMVTPPDPAVTDPAAKIKRLLSHCAAMVDVAPEYAGSHAAVSRFLDFVRAASA